MAKTTKKPVATPKSAKTLKPPVKSAKPAAKKTSHKVTKAKDKKAVKSAGTKPGVSKSALAKKIPTKAPARKALPKKPVLIKTPAKKVTTTKALVNKVKTTKAPVKKVSVKKVSVKKAPAKKVPAKKVPVKKTPAKKVSAIKATTKKVTTKKVTAKKVMVTKVPIKKVTATKVPAKKVPAEKVPAKKVSATKVIAAKTNAIKASTATKGSVHKVPVPAPKKQVDVKGSPAKLVGKKDSGEKTTHEKITGTLPAKEKGVKIFSKGKFDFSDEKGEITIERKLMALYNLQQIDSQVDKIRIIRGELPLEVQDLEDEIAGLETRIDNYILETVEHEKIIHEKEISIQDSQGLIKKYEDQQMNVRNNREYDSLTKEIEFQNLEIQLSQKRIREAQLALDAKKEEIAQYQKVLQDRKNDLEVKKNELDDIVAETEKEENELIKQSELNHKYIEERLITAYSRIRKNARNGLAVVQIERDACGGCFNKIPPQHQLDIRMHKKIIVCEYCGRILVDDIIVDAVN